jgi:hypothetical protein
MRVANYIERGTSQLLARELEMPEVVLEVPQPHAKENEAESSTVGG